MSITALSASFPEGNIASRLSLQHPSLFYTVVEQSSVAISLTDPQARICYANPAFCRQTGFALETLLGENHRLLASQQTPKHIYDEMWRTLLQGKSWNGQLINRRNNRSLYLADVTITPVLGADGQVEHYLGMHKDISEKYALEQRLRNHITLFTEVLNNIPAAVVVVDEQDNVVMDNLAYKTLCADCGGKELLAEMGYPQLKEMLNSGEPVPVSMRGNVRWFSFGQWLLQGVNEEASRFFTGITAPGKLIVLTDCTDQHHRQQQGYLDRLKQKLTNGKLLAAIRESLDAALIQLNGPINMLAAARRLNGEEGNNMALEFAWREGEQAVSRLQACRPSLDFEPQAEWPVSEFFDDLSALYDSHFLSDGELRYVVMPSDLHAVGQRTQILTALSLWIDHTLSQAQAMPSLKLSVNIVAKQDASWLCFDITDNVPRERVRYARPEAAFSRPGNGMELRLIQTLIAHHRGSLDLSVRPDGGTLLTLRLPVQQVLTGGLK